MFFYFKGKRIRLMFSKEVDIWWYWDDIANAFEISAEALLRELSEAQISEHVQVRDVPSMSNLDTTVLSDMGFNKDAKDFETHRLMDDWCLKYFIETHGDYTRVIEFKRWVDLTLYKAYRARFLLDYCWDSLNESIKIITAMKYLTFALNEDTLKTQVARLIAENNIIASALKVLSFSCEEDEIVRSQNHA